MRVLVANRPRLMRELVQATLSDHPDIEVVGEIQDGDAEILEAIDRTHPDFLILALGESEERPTVCDRVLQNYPKMKVIAIAAGRDATIFYWAALDIRSNRIETSEEGLLGALRGKIPNSGRSSWAS